MFSTPLTTAKKELLNKGISFAPSQKIKRKDTINLIVDLENAIQEQPHPAKAILAHKLEGTLSNDVKLDCPAHSYSNTRISIKREISANNLFLSKADKSNTIKILEHSQYLQKMTDFIHLNNLTIIN